jgi:hypothetical protein
MKNIYLGFFKFYQPKATGGGFLIFEWTLFVAEPVKKRTQRKKIRKQLQTDRNWRFICVTDSRSRRDTRGDPGRFWMKNTDTDIWKK